MAQNLVINGITYNGVDSISFVNDKGENVRFALVEEKKYTNVIKTSIAKGGGIFNDGKGWMANSRIGSGGIYAGNQTAGTDNAQWVTGHIEIDPNIDNTIRLKNVTFDTASTNGNHGVAFFDESFARISNGKVNWLQVINITNAGGYNVTKDGTNLTKFTLSATAHMTNKSVKYIAFCCGGLSDDSIITINEPIE